MSEYLVQVAYTTLECEKIEALSLRQAAKFFYAKNKSSVDNYAYPSWIGVCRITDNVSESKLFNVIDIKGV